MRKIKKLAPPENLAKYVRQENPQKFEEIHHSRYYPELYGECVEQLKTEQDNLSGYTEKPLKNGVHVDHYRKQALFNTQDMVFGWENMIADEHNSGYGADYKDKMVTMREEYAKLINPVLDDPHHYLTYMDEGIVKPVDGLSVQDREKAEKTIEVFNLRHPLLKELRERAIKMVKEYKAQGLNDAEILEALHDFGFTSAVEYALQDN